MTDDTFRLIPGVRVARGYRRSWLTADVVAGLVLTAILIPVGAVTAVVGVVLMFVLDEGGGNSANIVPVVGPSYAGAAGEFHF